MRRLIALFLLAPTFAQAVCMVPIVSGKRGPSQMEQQIYDNCVKQEQLDKEQETQLRRTEKTDLLHEMQERLQEQQEQIQQMQEQLRNLQEQVTQLQKQQRR